MNIANKISIFRILTVPFFIACLLYYTPERDHLRLLALGIFILGAISDAADGYIARRAKQISRAGMMLDPLGDKLLLMGSFIVLSMADLPQRIPFGVVFIVISRDTIILLGAVVVYLVKQDLIVAPTRWGKLTTTFQMLTVISVLVKFEYSFVLWSIAVCFTVVSGADYIRRGFKILYAVENNRHTD